MKPAWWIAGGLLGAGLFVCWNVLKSAAWWIFILCVLLAFGWSGK